MMEIQQNIALKWGDNQKLIESSFQKVKKIPYSIISIIIIAFLIFLIFFTINLYYDNKIEAVYSNPLFITHKTKRNSFDTIEQYWKIKNVSKLLQINATYKSFISQNQKYLQNINITYSDHISQSNQINSQQYDWIHINSYKLVNYNDLQLQKQINKILQNVKIGVSYIWESQQYKYIENYRVQSLIKYFANNGLIYKSVQSLKLRRFTGKIIFIFIKIGKIKSQSPILTQYQFLAIQTQIRPKYDLPFLKQWISYHISLGVSKFFLYETKENNQEQNQLIHCQQHSEDRIQYQLQNIMLAFPENIIYIPWQSKKISISFPFSLFFNHRLTNSKHDYIRNYQNFVNYTIFLRTDEMIFSSMGLKLSSSIIQHQKKGYNTFQMQTKHFQSRYCNKNSYMIQNYISFQVENFQNKILKIFLTKNFKIDHNKQLGNIRNKNSLIFNQKEWKVNQYSLTVPKLQKIKQKYSLSDIIVNEDFSAQGKKAVLKNLCKGDCFIKFPSFCINYFKAQLCPNQDQYQTSY